MYSGGTRNLGVASPPQPPGPSGRTHGPERNTRKNGKRERPAKAVPFFDIFSILLYHKILSYGGEHDRTEANRGEQRPTNFRVSGTFRDFAPFHEFCPSEAQRAPKLLTRFRGIRSISPRSFELLLSFRFRASLLFRSKSALTHSAERPKPGPKDHQCSP